MNPNLRRRIIAGEHMRYPVTRPALLIFTLTIAASLTMACGPKHKEGTPKASVAGPTLTRATVGVDNPAVDIIAFVGFECPHSRGAAQILMGLPKAHPKNVRIRIINLPLDTHPQSVELARGFVAARQIGQWKSYWNHIFAQSDVDTAQIDAWAKSVGVNQADFRKRMKSDEVSDEIAADAGLADVLGVAGTPSYLINGALLQGARPAAEWDKIIANQNALIKAKFATLKGTALAEALVKNNSPKRAPLYISHVLQGVVPKPATVPVKVRRASGVVAAKLMPAGGGGKGTIKLGAKPGARPEAPDTVWRVSVRSDDPARGPADAPVTLVAFSDYECKHSKALSSTLKMLSASYGASLRVIHKHNPLPFHKNAMMAAEASEAARTQGKFWQMHEALYASAEPLSRTTINKIAKIIGLDMTTYDNAMTAGGARQRIQRDIEQVASTGARGTPNLFINGKKVIGAKQAGQLKTFIDAALVKAKAKIASGQQAGTLYESLIAEGKLLDSLSPAKQKITTRPNQSRGPSGAVIHIVVFEDFQCPFCARLDPHIVAMEREFPNRVKVSWVDFPLTKIHPQANIAAQAGKEAAAQGKFWAFHDLLMKAQRQGQQQLDSAGLTELGKRAGLNTTKLSKALKSNAWGKAVTEDAAQAQRLGLKGTPSVFINGHAFSPQLGFSANTFRSAIRRLLGAQ
ncbi:MAG TPA: hypothetical protein DCQ06_06660 [Myxococcales bacterium]|nr:hypothetical protein [Myxococcales bacterium]